MRIIMITHSRLATVSCYVVKSLTRHIERVLHLIFKTQTQLNTPRRPAFKQIEPFPVRSQKRRATYFKDIKRPSSQLAFRPLYSKQQFFCVTKWLGLLDEIHREFTHTRHHDENWRSYSMRRSAVSQEIDLSLIIIVSWIFKN